MKCYCSLERFMQFYTYYVQQYKNINYYEVTARDIYVEYYGIQRVIQNAGII
jgi:hypothetical protein